MQTFTANKAKIHFTEFIYKAQRDPVKVIRRERTVSIMISEQEFESI
jgi:PHD/YefM family antitoxin component YafN of YafNO toxin-antitoxin module